MNVALWPLRMNVVSANAARPSGAGSATGSAGATATAGRSATTVMTTSFERRSVLVETRAGRHATDYDLPGRRPA
jgi:hypothetical protein